MNAFLNQDVLEIAGTSFAWGDVVRAAEAWGDWTAIRERAASNLAALAAEDVSFRGLGPADLDAAEAAFRYSRNLESAAEMEAWLDRWHLDEEDWRDWLRAQAIRSRLELSAPRLASAADVDPSAVHAESVCGGALERLAWKFAGRLSVRALTNVSLAPTPGDLHIPDLETAFRAFESRIAVSSAIEAAILDRRLEWTRVDTREIAFPSRDQAREARLMMSEDGLSLEMVGKTLRLAVRNEITFVEDAAVELASSLTSAAVGETIGPVESGGMFRLVVIAGKTPPNPDDPACTARAGRFLVSAAVTREVSRRVRWLWPV